MERIKISHNQIVHTISRQCDKICTPQFVNNRHQYATQKKILQNISSNRRNETDNINDCFLREPSATVFHTPMIQRILNKELIEQYCKKLEISSESLKIIEVPDNADADTPVGKYGEKHLNNIDPDLGKHPIYYFSGATDIDKSDKAVVFAALKGGAFYDDKNDVVVINENFSSSRILVGNQDPSKLFSTIENESLHDRFLLHEMGHHKQNTKGMNAQNTNGIILEYHNIILNENLFDENLRIHYSNDYTDGIRKKWPSLTQDKKTITLNRIFPSLIENMEIIEEAIVDSSANQNDIILYGEIYNTIYDKLNDSETKNDKTFIYFCIVHNMCNELMPDQSRIHWPEWNI